MFINLSIYYFIKLFIKYSKHHERCKLNVDEQGMCVFGTLRMEVIYSSNNVVNKTTQRAAGVKILFLGPTRKS